MKHGNPFGNISEKQARQIYEDLGLCYEHGQAYNRCGCPSPAEIAEEWSALSVFVKDVPPEPETVGEAVALDWPWTDEDMRDEILNRYPD